VRLSVYIYGMLESMQLSVVIPNYNGINLLRKRLPQVLKNVSSAEVVVVDDASTDDSVSLIKSNFPHVKLIEKATNTGFASSVNLGVKAATGDVILLLNTDAVPQLNFLTHLAPHFSDSMVFAVTCLDESIEGGKTVERGRGIGSFKHGFLVHARGGTNKTNTLWASGGSSAFRKSLWEKLGGMDEMYDPFYWEDIDLSYRALKSGYIIIFEPKSLVRHEHAQGSIKMHYSLNQIKTQSYRNQFIFVWKNITDLELLARHLIWLPYHFIRAFMNWELELLYGFGQALLKIGTVIQRRQNTHYVKTDNEVLVQFEN